MEEEKGAWGGSRPGAGRKKIGSEVRTIRLSEEANNLLKEKKNISAYISSLIMADLSSSPLERIGALAEEIKSLSEQLKNNS